MSAKLAFTCGDPAGVGPEIIAAWLDAHRDEAGGVAVIGPARWLRTLPKTEAQLVAVSAEGAGGTEGGSGGRDSGSGDGWRQVATGGAGSAGSAGGAGGAGGTSGGSGAGGGRGRSGAEGAEGAGGGRGRSGAEGAEGAGGAGGGGDFAGVAGEPSVEGARVALAALERAAAGTRTGEFSGVVTGPVSKAWLQRAGCVFPGQTEFFAARWGGKPTMAFCGGRLRVVLLTWHIPLREVPSHLTPDELARAVRAADELARAGGVAEPRIGVCGLNPHAGEGGLLGTEERDVIEPILDALRAGRGMGAMGAMGGMGGMGGAGSAGARGEMGSARALARVSRCEPGDTIFGRALRGEFDVVVALYHDQGLAPLKTIDFDEAVNVTLGLAHVRTSPDHGTAFGIAGRGTASPRSFGNAVAVARRLIAWRASRESQ